MPFYMKFAPLCQRLFNPNNHDSTALSRFCPHRWFTTNRLLLSFEDHYKTLELKEEASPNEIKDAYYRLSKIHHPDVNAENGKADKFKALSTAYEIMSDPAKRSLYDGERRYAVRGVRVSHRYPGNAEYRGGPRRQPTDPDNPYDDFIYYGGVRGTGRSTGESDGKTKNPAYQYFWPAFFGYMGLWFVITMCIFFTDSNHGSGTVDFNSRREPDRVFSSHERNTYQEHDRSVNYLRGLHGAQLQPQSYDPLLRMKAEERKKLKAEERKHKAENQTVR